MKWLIFTLSIILLLNDTLAVAKQEKIIKKPLNLKPTKISKTVVDEFRQHLTPEDAEFIKQIDKQFAKHGDKLTIKLERDNATKPANKNTKRTIDDSLGYSSYQQNMHPNGYYFSRPIYMHKFTSRDVPTERDYNEKATEIEIQKSHSYEIKPDHQYEHSESKQNYHQANPQQPQVYEDPVPVIVLRVPGPQKYAVHLQALLQQYLEIRAAQFLKVLEEQERQGNLMNPQQLQHHHQQQLHHQQQHHHQQQQQQQQHQQHYTPQEQVAYIPMIAITPMYHSYYQQQQQHPQQQQQQQHHHQQHAYRQYYQQQQQQQHQQQMHQATLHHRVPAGEQSYYRQPQIQQQIQPQIHHHSQPQQHFHKHPVPTYHSPTPQPQKHHHATSFITFVTPTYSQTHEEQHHQNHHEPLQTSENYPSDKHTQVIFKKKKNRHHVQPSITYHQSEPIVVPEVAPQHQHQQDEQIYVAHQEEHASVTHQPIYEHENDHKEYQHEAEIITVTDRTKAPYNYHIAGPTLAPTQEELHARHHPKRMAPFSKDQFEKARRIMDKSKRSRGSMKLEKVVMEKTAMKSS